MRTHVILTLAVLLITVTLSACGPSQAEQDATITRIAADVLATQTAEAPTLTFTPTPTATSTPTPTPTLTPTPTPTPIPTSTSTPTVTPTPGPDLSEAVLTLEDLPPGFEAIPPDEFGFTKEDLSQEDFTVEETFIFMEAEHFELIMGFTTLVSTRIEQAGFDAGLRRSDFLMGAFIEGMGEADILEEEELSGLDDIGDASGGWTVVADMEGIPMRIDTVAFRRDIVGVFIFVMYIDGDVPVVPVGDVARKLDDRVIEVLASSALSTTIKIGLDVPMTGDFAYVGTQSQRAAEIMVADINEAGGKWAVRSTPLS